MAREIPQTMRIPAKREQERAFAQHQAAEARGSGARLVGSQETFSPQGSWAVTRRYKHTSFHSHPFSNCLWYPENRKKVSYLQLQRCTYNTYIFIDRKPK